MSLVHAAEKFNSAHGTLLTGQDEIRQRLRSAGMDVLQVDASNTELPISLQARIKSLQMLLTSADQDEHRDGKLGATLRRTSDQECSGIADEIGEIAHALHSELRSRIDNRSNESDTTDPEGGEPPELVM